MSKKLLLLLITSYQLSAEEVETSAISQDSITEQSVSNEDFAQFKLKVAAFVKSYVYKIHENDPIQPGILRNIQCVPLEGLKEILEVALFSMKRRVPFALGILEGLYELRLNHERAKAQLPEEFAFKCDYCIYIIDSLINQELGFN